MLRAVAIVAIVACHLSKVIPAFVTPSITWIENCLSFFGLCLFFMLSGYSLMLKEKKFNSFGDVITFYKKRLFRLFPLYWIALVVATISRPLLHPSYLDFSFEQNVITIVGLQILFPSIVVSGLMWFVSAILILYLIFPAIIVLAKKIDLTLIRSIVLSGLIIYVLIVLTSILLPVDIRFFEYYWFFIGGIIMGKYMVLSHVNLKRLIGISISASVGFWIIISIQKKIFPFADITRYTLPLSIMEMFIITFVGIISISAVIAIIKTFRKYFSGVLHSMVERIAKSTYSIYFFHIYFLQLASSLALLISSDLVPYFVLLFGIPMAIAIPPYLETFVDTLKFKLVGLAHRAKAIHKISRGSNDENNNLG